MTAETQNPRQAIGRLNLVGFVMLGVMVGGVGAWSAATELSGAVIAPGTLVVESNIKKVQHSTGGIVGEILVKEGMQVEAGQIVMRLDDTLAKSSLGISRAQMDELMAREARLLAERDGADRVAVPEVLLPRRTEASVAAALMGEEKLFDSRQRSRSGQRAQLRERTAQMNEEGRGLAAQLAAKESEIRFISEELTGVQELYKKNLIPIIRYMQLQRDYARLSGERGQLIAEIARGRG